MKKRVRMICIIFIVVLIILLFLLSKIGNIKNDISNENNIKNEVKNVSDDGKLNDGEYPKFRGIVEEFNGKSMIVKPLEKDDVIALSGDKVFVDLGEDNDMLYFDGEEVVITYTGEIAETYPVQINVVEIEVEYENIIRIEDLPEDYDLDSAINNNCIIVTNMNEIYNKSEFDRFVKNVNDNIPDFVRIINYTTEGDMIITDVRFEGDNTFSVCYDTTRDQFANLESRKYTYYTFKDLVFEENDQIKMYYLENSIEGNMDKISILNLNKNIKVIE